MAQSQDPFSTVVPFEVPGSIREFAEKGVSQARETYEKFKDVAQSSNETIEAVYASASKGAADYSGKLLDIARTNTNAAFDVAEKLVAVKSPSDIFSIWQTYARSQYESLTAQTKELVELSQRVASETVEPIKTASSKVFNKVA
jgi:phasin